MNVPVQVEVPVQEEERVRYTLSIPTSAFTLEGFRKWALSDEFPEKGVQVSFLGTEIYVDMSPERAGSHNALRTELYKTLTLLVESVDSGQFFPDNFLITNEEAEVSNEPDATFVRWETFASGRVKQTPSADEDDVVELVGTPDLVVEIVSPSSTRKDLTQLRERYHKAGIPEYWLIDARRATIKFHLLKHTPEKYVAEEAQDGWLASPVFGRRFKLEREKNRVGNWRYTLHVDPPIAGPAT